jgi:hypothetical protein
MLTVAFHILVGDARRLLPRRRSALALGQRREECAHPLDTPAQVHRRRTCQQQHVTGRLQRRIRSMVLHRQRHAVSRRHADQRRAAHLHVAYRALGIAHILQAQRGEDVRKPGLVDDLHRRVVGGGPDGAIGGAVNFHGL